MLKAKIYSSPEKCMKGVELRRLRETAGLTQQQLADKLESWGWYEKKVKRFEKRKDFCLSAQEMQALLDALGARSL